MLLLTTYMINHSFAQEIPFVYVIENSGANFPKPVLPSFSELPIVEPLTDPFEWSNGSGRDTAFASWSYRRAEIKAEIEHYEIGKKPDRPDSITFEIPKEIFVSLKVYNILGVEIEEL